jgi:hypothetical protein
MSLLLLFGQAAAVTYTKAGTAAAGTRLAGTDVYESAETGAVTTAARLAGTDAFQATETGTAGSQASLTGPAQAGFVSKLGTATAGAVVSGPDVFTASRAATAAAATWAAGGDASTLTRAGTVKAAARLSGFTRGQPGPAGKFVLKNAKIVLGGVDLSRFCNTVQMTLEAEEIDITPLGSSYQDHMQGATTGEFTLELFADQTVITPAFWASLDTITQLQITPRGDQPTASENPTWTTDVLAVRRTQLAGQVGDAATASVELRSTGPVLQIES